MGVSGMAEVGAAAGAIGVQKEPRVAAIDKLSGSATSAALGVPLIGVPDAHGD